MTPLAELLSGHPLPDRSGGKDDSGTVLVVAPSAWCPGAGLLAGRAALRCGSGRVQLVVHPSVAAAVAVALPEALVAPWDVEEPAPSWVLERVAAADVVLVGPGSDGLGAGPVAAVTASARLVVLDAGALPQAASVDSDRLVVAPNLAEAQGLLGAEADESDVAELAARLSGSLGCPVAVRGPRSAVSDGSGTWVGAEAPPGLGTPGSGDVLVGVLAALLAAGVDRIAALGWAVRLHGDAGDHQPAEAGYLASELVDALPAVLDRAERSASVEDGG